MILDLLIIAAAFFILIQGADYFVRGAGSMGRKIGISTLVVGLTIVSIGTSAPELFVNVFAATNGNTALSIGNVLGSNLADILLGLGIAALIAPLAIKQGTVWKEIPFALMGALLILIFGSDVLLTGIGPNEIGRIEGIALLGFFIIFLVYVFGLAKEEGEYGERIERFGWARSFFYAIGGVAALALGGKLVVDHGVSLATQLGVSENLIGLTIIAAGTSLPEIVTALTAARKRYTDLVVGGMVGTVIFNALFVLGVTAIVRPLPFHGDNIVDAVVLVIGTLLLFGFMFVGRRHVLKRWEGVVFIAFYMLYLVFIVLRG